MQPPTHGGNSKEGLVDSTFSTKDRKKVKPARAKPTCRKNTMAFCFVTTSCQEGGMLALGRKKNKKERESSSTPAAQL